MQSKQGVTLSTLGYSVDCSKSVYNYYSTVGRFFQVNNSIIAVVIDIFKNCRYKHKKALPFLGGCVSYYIVSGHGSSVVYDILVNRKSPMSRSVGTGSSNCKRSWLPSPGPPK